MKVELKNLKHSECFCEECDKTLPLNQLSAMGYRCAECDPTCIAEEGRAADLEQLWAEKERVSNNSGE